MGCELTDLRLLVGNNVSHSNRKTKRVFLPNLQNMTLFSDALNQNVSLRIAARTLRSIDKFGGLDKFLLGTSNRKLSLKAKGMCKKIQNRIDAIAESDAEEKQSKQSKQSK